MSDAARRRSMDATGATRCDDPHHCITCSDEGVPMRVLALDSDKSIARCEAETGAESDVLVGLIENLEVGETVVVHAGTALSRLLT